LLPAFTGKRQYLYVIGAYNWRDDWVTNLNVEWKNSNTFIKFLEKLLIQVYPTQAVVLMIGQHLLSLQCQSPIASKLI